MYLIPLTQVESVELVIHALRAAGGKADCSTCPVRKVCMQQCLAIADSIVRMVETNTLPVLGEPPAPAPELPAAASRQGLKLIK